MHENSHSHPTNDQVGDAAADAVVEEDLIDRINALTDDAASWTAADEPTQTRWAQPTPDTMTAIELTMTSGAPIEISATEPASAIVEQVGDPFINQIRHLRQVALWVGDNSAACQPVNTGATAFLRALLTDVRDGLYVASDAERDHAQALLASTDFPVIHGPCLVTGIAADGETPAPFDENFGSWFSGVLDEVQAAIIDDLARRVGLHIEQVGGAIVVFLD